MEAEWYVSMRLMVSQDVPSLTLNRGVWWDDIRVRDSVPASYSAAKRVQVFLGLVPAGVSSYKGG